MSLPVDTTAVVSILTSDPVIQLWGAIFGVLVLVIKSLLSKKH